MSNSDRKERKYTIYYSQGLRDFLPESAGILELQKVADTSVPHAPIEDGSFSAYNKIPVPNRVSVKIAHEGEDIDRLLFEADLDEARTSTSLFLISTPTGFFSDMTLESYSQTIATLDGHYIAIYDCEFVEIQLRRLVEGEMRNKEELKDYTNAATVDKGKVNPKEIESLAKEMRDDFRNSGYGNS